ncbi:hypothetical protein Gotri_003900 [Gossypium trilobum]|uniref:DDE Tnp4 domain-containing protein n=1 Tax=Gossypium trilobum TaxID=34281 RepID=A0A7J9F3D5_9ROSI|nr:hypothetical protein [Gossypium trilobum]
MLGFCTPDIHFVYVLPGWEGSVVDGRVLQDAISRRYGLKVPHGCYYLVDASSTNCERFFVPFRGQIYHLNELHQGYQPSTPEEFFNMKHASARNVNERCFGKWVLEEDVVLVACMLDLHNVETFNAYTRFKAGYLNELERIRKDNSNFGWDEHRQLVVAKDVVWNSYISSHKEASQFRHRTFPYYDQLTAIYAKDKATGKDAQTAATIIEEIDAKDVATNCLGALDGTHIKIRVPKVDKPRYRTRKSDIATNMLGVCTPDIHFVYVLPGWEGSIADGRVLRDAISRRHELKFLHAELGEELPSNVIDNDESNIVNTHPSDAWKWVPEEDATLVSCMVNLHNVGTFNANMRFKAGYLNELERMLEKVLPHAMLKAKPNLESRIRTLKRDLAIVYDMLSGKDNSSFGWDKHR